ncbi:MAG: hypothetical protein IPG79_09680 [Saprospiraceae bacterium]|nr:hypothetical protein [Saprospiraceae bacterium]
MLSHTLLQHIRPMPSKLLKALKIKFEFSDEETYNPEFVEKILESKEQVKNGKVTGVKKENLKEFLGL